MSLQLGQLRTIAQHIENLPPRTQGLRVQDALYRIADWINALVQKVDQLEKRVISPTTAPTTWLALTSSATVTISPANSSWQKLVPATDLTIALTAGYTGTTSLWLRIDQPATPRIVTFHADWRIPDSAIVEPAANTYTLLQILFDAGVPYLATHLTGNSTPP